LVRKYVPIEDEYNNSSKKKSKKKAKKLFDDEVKKDFDAILQEFNKKVLENKKQGKIFEKAKPHNFGKVIPPKDTYSKPPMTEEERARYSDLKTIVTNIKDNSPKDNNHEGEVESAFRKLLNERQSEAVFALNGPVLVIAGAGSGKTRTIVHRVAYMLEKGIDPYSILLLTFTKRASGEMISRVNTLTGSDAASKITAGTFHSFANMSLRIYGQMIGIKPNFTICDQVDASDIIDLVKNDLNLKKRSKPFPKKRIVAEIISRARNTLKPVGFVIDQQYSKYTEFTEDIVAISEKYDIFKKERNVFDYDDLLERFLDGLKSSKKFLEKIQRRYRFVMVDEYQDTNTFQGEIADLIALPERNIMVVGDDLQSIYGFRGAAFENILRFPVKWSDCRIVKLEQNYRSKKELLDFTNSIVDNCYAAYKKVLFSDMSGSVEPIVIRVADAESEAVFIADEIDKALEKIPPGEISVLYRSGHHSNFIQAELLKRNIEFAVYGGIKFIERRHVKDIISYAKIIQNPLDSVALNRVLKLIPGIGAQTAVKIISDITEFGFNSISRHSKRKYFDDLREMFSVIFDAGKEELSSIERIDIIVSYYLPILKSLEADYDDRVKDIAVLRQIVSNYKSLEKFLSDFSLDPPSSQLSSGEAQTTDEITGEKVVLSTVHSAKGLEWNTVFVIHLLDGCFPSERSIGRMDDLEEERRLFYVACSRAKEALFLTFPAAMSFYGGNLTLPSRFIAEIDEKYYKIQE
jgi:DNA helicase II / ATP-dependent DNA helicase PcrA